MIKYPLEIMQKDNNIDIRLRNIMEPGKKLEFMKDFGLDSDYQDASIKRFAT